MSINHVILLLGSNLGDREANLAVAMKKIETHIGSIVSSSQVLQSVPVEFASTNFFCNIAIRVTTNASPMKLLKIIKTIERSMGRALDSRSVGGYTDRSIDIDIVQFNSLKFRSQALEIPHQKHLFEREFSKILLLELDEKTKTQI